MHAELMNRHDVGVLELTGDLGFLDKPGLLPALPRVTLVVSFDLKQWYISRKALRQVLSRCCGRTDRSLTAGGFAPRSAGGPSFAHVMTDQVMITSPAACQ